MPNSLDQVSRTLGNLEASQSNQTRDISILNTKIDKILDKLTIMNGSISKAHGRIDEITDPVDGDLTVAYMASTDWVDTKKKAKWIILGGSLVGTAGGFSIGKFILNLFGHSS